MKKVLIYTIKDNIKEVLYEDVLRDKKESSDYEQRKAVIKTIMPLVNSAGLDTWEEMRDDILKSYDAILNLKICKVDYLFFIEYYRPTKFHLEITNFVDIKQKGR